MNQIYWTQLISCWWFIIYLIKNFTVWPACFFEDEDLELPKSGKGLCEHFCNGIKIKSTTFVLIGAHAPISTHPLYLEAKNHKIINHLPRSIHETNIYAEFNMIWNEPENSLNNSIKERRNTRYLNRARTFLHFSLCFISLV